MTMPMFASEGQRGKNTKTKLRKKKPKKKARQKEPNEPPQIHGAGTKSIGQAPNPRSHIKEEPIRGQTSAKRESKKQHQRQEKKKSVFVGVTPS